MEDMARLRFVVYIQHAHLRCISVHIFNMQHLRKDHKQFKTKKVKPTNKKKHSNLSLPSQATIMVFQAVAQYRIQVKEVKQLDLEMTIRVEGSRQPIVWKFRKDNSHLAQTEKVSLCRK